MVSRKKALITGAAGDIGSCVSELLQAEGYELILVDVDEDRLIQVCVSLPGSTAVTLDQNNREDVNQLIDRIENEFGHIDVAFINAGIVGVGNVIDMAPKLIDLQLEVNLTSAIHLIRSCAKTWLSMNQGTSFQRFQWAGLFH